MESGPRFTSAKFWHLVSVHCLELSYLVCLGGYIPFHLNVDFAGEGIPSSCVVKVVDFPLDHLFHACILDIFSEAYILQALRDHVSFSHLYDFGVNQDSVYLVMRDYKCSLLVPDIKTLDPELESVTLEFLSGLG